MEEQRRRLAEEERNRRAAQDFSRMTLGGGGAQPAAPHAPQHYPPAYQVAPCLAPHCSGHHRSFNNLALWKRCFRLLDKGCGFETVVIAAVAQLAVLLRQLTQDPHARGSKQNAKWSSRCQISNSRLSATASFLRSSCWTSQACLHLNVVSLPDVWR